jgi:hypothetical protein
LRRLDGKRFQDAIGCRKKVIEQPSMRQQGPRRIGLIKRQSLYGELI